MKSQDKTSDIAPKYSDLAAQSRLFVLEMGMNRPLDYALSHGTHELKDCGVILHLDPAAADESTLHVTASWLGYGPRAFLLPGARQLQKGQWTQAEDRARISWAGREWLFVAHVLRGDGTVLPKGICLNGGAAGFPAPALLVVETGKDRGNFYRFRTQPFTVAPGVMFLSVRAKDGTESMHLRVSKAAPAVLLDGDAVLPGTDQVIVSEQLLAIGDSADLAALTARVILAI